jgi:hypothetical protein
LSRYTRETRWTPPPGAPRIELEWWEKTFAERKAAEAKAAARRGGDKAALADFAEAASSKKQAAGDGDGDGDGVLL